MIKNILLADDDADDRMFFEDALKQVTIPTQLTLAHDGLELMTNLETIHEPPLLIIFLDLNMPRKNGFQCLEEIRNTPSLKHIPVIIFSTTAHDDAINITYQQGATYYIQKPNSFARLVKIIEKVLLLDSLHKPQPSKEKYVLQVAD